MVDEQSRHVEQRRHPGHHRNHVQRLDPEIEAVGLPDEKPDERRGKTAKRNHCSDPRPVAWTAIPLAFIHQRAPRTRDTSAETFSGSACGVIP
ncbi:hypothetical protein D3C86_1879020 [compost metagenome]